MSFFDIGQVRGEHIAHKVKFEFKAQDVLPLTDLPLGTIKTVELISAAGEPLYKITAKAQEDKADEVSYFDGRTGAPWSGASEATARRAAAVYYTGETAPQQFVKLRAAPIEYRGALPVWQISYADGPKTRLYLDGQTAELKAVRTRLWRVFDFMWMLHIMDYDGRDNINNWWLWLAAFLSAMFALSGLALVTHRIFLRPRRGPVQSSQMPKT